MAGLHGLLVYTISGAIPIVGFAAVGPAIRKKCPEGFVLTEWVRQRYGTVTGLYLSFFTCLTMFLFMIAELSALRMAIETLTTINGRSAIVVQCVVTTIYTSFGGFSVSFTTDILQGAMVLVLVVICTIAMGTKIDIDHSLIAPSGLLNANLLGWQLMYILPVAIITNDCFLSGFWLRTFASRSNRDLWIATLIASAVTFLICTLVGATGFITVWSGLMTPADIDGYKSFYVLLNTMPGWVVGFVLVFVVWLSTTLFDSMHSAMVSTISNDIFRNRLRTRYLRGLVVVIMIPVVILAVNKWSYGILELYLFADLVSAAIIPSIFLGSSDRYFWFLRGTDIIVGGMGSLLGVFVFGTVYYGLAEEGGLLLLISNGLYDSSDWGPFGAFVVTFVGGVVFSLTCAAVRILVLYAYSKATSTPFTTLDRVETQKYDPFSVEEAENLAINESLDRMSLEQTLNTEDVEQTVNTKDVKRRSIDF